MGALSSFCDVSLNLVSKGSNEQFKDKCNTCFISKHRKPSRASISGANPLPQNRDLPRVVPKDKKKPFVAPPRRVTKSRLEKPHLEDAHSPPGNGLLVLELIPVAHAVFEARETLLKLVALLMPIVPVKACKFCDHSHVGPIGHDLATCEGPGSSDRHGRHVWTIGCVDDVISNLDAYHSYDRQKLIRHNDKRTLKRLPAVVELCVQAGLDLPGYPVVRNFEPVRGTGRRKIHVDDMCFEVAADLDLWEEEAFHGSKQPSLSNSAWSRRERSIFGSKLHNNGKMNPDWSFEEVLKAGRQSLTLQSVEDTKQIAETALRLWEVMRTGAERLMARYTVRACGYCPEVHIGPRGHLVRLCGAYKHQWREGQHGWQVAGLDDLIPPKYVWHVRDLKNPLLLNESRSFYGQAPAVVELCAQAGAEIPERYKPMMRLDVVTPTYYEAQTAV